MHKEVVLPALLVAAVIILAGQALATTHFTTCQGVGELDTKGETYLLDNDVPCLGADACFMILNDSVTLDCQGHAITGSCFYNSIVSEIHDNLDIRTVNTNNVVVKNCDIEVPNAVSLNGTNITVLNFKGTAGIVVRGENTTIANTSAGYLGAGPKALILNNKIVTTYKLGIGIDSKYGGDGYSRVENNSIWISDNAVELGPTYGIDSSTFGASHSVIVNNTIIIGGLNTCQGIGFNNEGAYGDVQLTNLTIANNTIFTNCTASNNYGISLEGRFSNTSILNNFIRSNGTHDNYGIELYSPWENSYNVRVAGNNINANGSTHDWSDMGIYVENGVFNSSVENNVFYKGVGSAILTQDASGLLIKNNSIWDNGNRGIQLDAGTNNSIVANNRVWDNVDNGIYLTANSLNNTVENNTIDNAGWAGLSCDASQNNTFRNNVVNVTSGSSGVFLSECSRVNVTNNTIIYPGDLGIKVQNSNNVTIKLNSIFGNVFNSAILLMPNEGAVQYCIVANNLLTRASWGLDSEFGASDNVWENNTINESDDNGIYVNAASNDVFRNNIITGTGSGQAGMYIQADNNHFINNTVRNSGGVGVQVQDGNANEVRGNTITNNTDDTAILVTLAEGSDNNNVITNNVVLDADSGIKVSYAAGTTLANNTINDTRLNALYLVSTTATTVRNNTITNTQDSSGDDVIKNSNAAGVDFIGNTIDGAPGFVWRPSGSDDIDWTNNTFKDIMRPILLADAGSNTEFVGDVWSNVSIPVIIKDRDIYQTNFTDCDVPPHLALVNSSVMDVNFTGTLSFGATQDFDNLMIGNQSVNINSSKEPVFNVSADIGMRQVTRSSPKVFIFKENILDFRPCPASVCKNESYAGDMFVFNVSHFTNYTLNDFGFAVPYQFLAPLDTASSTGYIYNASVIGHNITNGATSYFDNLITVRERASGDRKLQFTGQFSEDDVDARLVTIQSNGGVTAVNWTVGSAIPLNHTLWVPRSSGKGVYVCPSAKVVTDVSQSCAGKVAFTDAEAASCTSKQSDGQTYTACIDGSDYNVSGLQGTGIANLDSATLTIWDETDVSMPYAGYTRYVGDLVTFYANFTNATGQTANTTNGACGIDYQTPNYFIYLPMYYNTTTKLFQTNRTFSSAGTFNWKVNCTGTNSGSQANLEATDTVVILAAPEVPVSGQVPEFSTFALLAALGIVAAGVVSLRRR